jgi:hypothetical protein
VQLLGDWWRSLVCFAHEASYWNSIGLFSDTGKKRIKGAIRSSDETRNNPIHGVMPESPPNSGYW